jgi:hypothetical protein
MCPQASRLSPEYSYKAGLQTVITEMPLQIRPVMRSGHAGLLQWAGLHVGLRVGRSAEWGDLAVGLRPAACWTKVGVCQSSCIRWCSEICRRHQAKGSVFAFTPTFALRGTSSTKSSGAEGVARWWRRCPRSKWFRGVF